MKKYLYVLPLIFTFFIIFIFFSSCNFENPTESLIHELINPNDAITYDSGLVVKDLMTSPKNNIGKLYIWHDSHYIYFKYKSTSTYTFKNLHLAVYPLENRIPVIDGCPKIENYPYIKANLPITTREYTFQLEFPGYPLSDIRYYYSAEAELELSPPPIGTECYATAWSDGTKFGRCSTWSTYYFVFFSNSMNK